MNNHYELLNLFPATLSDEEAKQEHEKIVSFVQSADGVLLNQEFYGRKKLAYQVGTQKTGVYSNIDFELEPPKTAELQSSIKLNSRTERFLLTLFVAPNKRVFVAPQGVPTKKEIDVKPKGLKPEDIAKLDTKIEELLTEEIK